MRTALLCLNSFSWTGFIDFIVEPTMNLLGDVLAKLLTPVANDGSQGNGSETAGAPSSASPSPSVLSSSAQQQLPERTELPSPSWTATGLSLSQHTTSTVPVSLSDATRRDVPVFIEIITSNVAPKPFRNRGHTAHCTGARRLTAARAYRMEP